MQQSRKFKTRFVLWSVVFSLGLSGLFFLTVATFYFLNHEYKWYSKDSSYICRSIYIHSNKIQYWAVCEVPAGRPYDYSGDTLVTATRIQSAWHRLRVAKDELAGAESELIDYQRHPTRLATIGPLILRDKYVDEATPEEAVQLTRAQLQSEKSSLEALRELAIQSAAKVSHDQSFLGLFYSKKGDPIKETLVQIPLWFLVMPFLLLSAAGLRVRTLYRRVRTGACVDCGYDLRASHGERCPECGTTISRANSTGILADC